jgi:hypothetical protein
MLFTVAVALLCAPGGIGFAPALPHLREDSVIYEIDPSKFGSGAVGDKGLDSIVNHIDYITALGVSAVSFTTTPSSLKDDEPAIRAIRDADLGVIVPFGAAVSPKSVVGWTAQPDDLKSPALPAKRWIGGFSDGDASGNVHAGGYSSVSDDRWRKDVFQFVRDETVTPSGFEKTLDAFRSGYGDAADGLLLRLTPPAGPRLKEALRGDVREMAQAWALLFTFPGVPMLEFGDEIGMAGFDDPMNWDQGSADKATLQKIQALITLRRQRPSLYRGTYEVIVDDDPNHVFGFERHDRFESTLVFFNNSDDNWSETLARGRFGTNLLTDLVTGTTYGQSSRLIVAVPAHGFVIIGN